jgi:predicted DNA-binding antitoxin AbrB/MazE fold protein
MASMTKISAIFEHGVFRPIEPVHVHDGAHVELSFEEADATSNPRGEIAIAIVIGPHGLPVITPAPGSRPITNEDVARGLEDC